MSGKLYTTWKDSLGVLHVDESVAIYENGKIYLTIDGFLGTAKKGDLIGEYENGVVYKLRRGVFNYAKRENAVAVIENGSIYSVQNNIFGGVSKSLSIGECAGGKIYSNSHEFIERSESVGLYDGDVDGAAAAAAIVLFELDSDVSAYYEEKEDKKYASRTYSEDKDLWEEYGLLMPVVVTYRLFKYAFIVCGWIIKVVIWIFYLVFGLIKKMSEEKNSLESTSLESVSQIVNEESQECNMDNVEKFIADNPSQVADDIDGNVGLSQEESVYADGENSEIQTKEKENLSSTTFEIAETSNKKNILLGLCVVILIIMVIISSMALGFAITAYRRTNENAIVSGNENNYHILASKIVKVERSDSPAYQLIYHDEKGREIKYEGFDNEGLLDWYGIIEYNEAGNMLSWTDYDENDNMFSKTEFLYDENGKKTKEIVFNEKGKPEAYIKYIHEKQKVTEIWCDQNWNQANEYCYVEYYEEGKVIRNETYKNNALKEYSITEYNKIGVKTQTTEYDAEGNLLAVIKYKIIIPEQKDYLENSIDVSQTQGKITSTVENNLPEPPQKISSGEVNTQDSERPQRIETNSTETYISKYVRPFCNEFINGNLESFKLSTSGKTKYWYDGYGLLKMEKPSGTDNYDMSRQYYFDSVDGELIFAFLFDKTVEHRLYFKDGILIRYIDPSKNKFENPTSKYVMDMANYAMWEAYQ